MKKVLLFICAISLLACNDKKPEISGIIKSNMDTLVLPGDNFEEFVNGSWLKANAIPADKSSFGSFDLLYDQSQKDVREIIENAAKQNTTEGSEEQKIGDFYASYVNRKMRNEKGINPIIPYLKQIDSIQNYTDLAGYFGKANRLGIATPFSISVTEDFKNPNKNVLMTWQGGLGLPERDYYLSEDAKMKDIRNKYVQHVQKMLTLSNVQDASAKASEVMSLETKLASIQMKKEETRDATKLYNVYKFSDLNKLMPNFDWNVMLNNAGFGDQKAVVVSQVEYTKKLNDLIQKTPISSWKIFLKWKVIDNASTYLSDDLDAQNFEFYGKVLSGKEKQEEDWKRGVSAVNGSLGELVGKVYVKKHFSPEAKEKMVAMVNNLLDAYAESIKKLDWMSENTKKQALDKVKKFTVKIGYPDKWKDYSNLKINKIDLFGNIERSTLVEYNRMLEKLDKPVDRAEWGMTPQTVNAYYNPTLNEIVFPAAILQPPFFNLKADDAVNYGGIGAVIGHEIGHGFDDQGSGFDGDGVMRNWWTKEDLTKFKNKTNTLVGQYSGFKPFDDLNLNGEFTLGENIGDLGGLSIAIKAYKKCLNGKEAPVLDGYTGLQRVFIGWGQVWLENVREESLRSQIASDPHSPAKYRINGVVRNIPEFYEAFKIKPSDSLYLAPKDRVKIW
ncbi:MAG: putative endopeptidase [Flavobacterium sp.]|jgi:putative endopeptidase